MALDAPDIPEMDSLVGQPFMGLQYIDLAPFRKKLEMTKVSMAIQANGVVILYCLLYIFRIPDIYFVGMRIMTFPA